MQRGQLLDVVAGREAVKCCAWFAERSRAWRDQVRWATLDLSSLCRVVLDTVLPDAIQVADPCHVVHLANVALDECRRRVQNETVGHRGREHDLLHRSRRRLVMAAEHLTVDGRERLMGLLAAGDPHREAWFAWNAKEVVRQIYDHTAPELARQWVDEIARDYTDTELPFEVRRLGRTICRWRDKSIAWHEAHGRTRPTEAITNLIRRVKRTAFGFRRFQHYCIRALLYAGRPNWELLATLIPR